VGRIALDVPRLDRLAALQHAGGGQSARRDEQPAERHAAGEDGPAPPGAPRSRADESVAQLGQDQRGLGAGERVAQLGQDRHPAPSLMRRRSRPSPRLTRWRTTASEQRRSPAMSAYSRSSSTRARRACACSVGSSASHASTIASPSAATSCSISST
jgi:hypothetical protein